jgi:hypothetical protein
MRRSVIFAAILTLSSACTACASMPRGPQHPACAKVNSATLTDRLTDPCGFADALGECMGLPAAERDRIRMRCEMEKSVLNATSPANCQE